MYYLQRLLLFHKTCDWAWESISSTLPCHLLAGWKRTKERHTKSQAHLAYGWVERVPEMIGTQPPHLVLIWSTPSRCMIASLPWDMFRYHVIAYARLDHALKDRDAWPMTQIGSWDKRSSICFYFGWVEAETHRYCGRLRLRSELLVA